MVKEKARFLRHLMEVLKAVSSTSNFGNQTAGIDAIATFSDKNHGYGYTL